jgi:tetratricopeptide (TPR) repeat protein
LSELRDRLQAAVGDNYRIERELGGGGMSRVFLAEEVELGRRVVIKVLPPEMGAGVNVDRFKREIQLAARLQHPHVVPLLAAGSRGDLLYYTMPFIEGQSLRERLARHGELPVGEAVRILREVADALAYAHRSQVVHRDIKPDNVLLSEGHAVVTDFGVAKAVSASTGASSLTSLGVALGTPSYMAPEQAVADPNVDHRADIYALGVMAYEMLTGAPPFTGSPQAVLAMHVTEQASPVTTHRSAVSPALNAVIMRCLEKKAADRYQKADELLLHLDALLTPSGGMTPTGVQPVLAAAPAPDPGSRGPLQAGAIFVVAAVAVLLAVWVVVRLAGLPDWVFAAAAGLLLVGFPIIVLTGHHERRRAKALATGMHHTTPAGMRRYFTWRKALWGGGLAFAGLAVMAGGFMASRLSGIGPAATLLSSGALDARQPLILADFVHRGGDAALAGSVTELFRVDIGQSPAVKLMAAGDLAAALQRMQREAPEILSFELAREIAQREGVSGVIAGEINPIGAGAVISVRIASPADASDLVALRETANGPDDIIPAINTLSRRLRARIGESLRSIRSAPSLERVTTGSLEALRLYSQALRVLDARGDDESALRNLREAVAVDTAFAMAWRKIAVILSNQGGQPAAMADAAIRAFTFRDRLPGRERLLAEAFYYSSVVMDQDETVRVYRRLLERDPDDPTALNNLALRLNTRGEYAEAAELTRRGLAVAPTVQPLYSNRMDALAGLGRLDEAAQVPELARANIPENPWGPWAAALFPAVRRDFRAADSAFSVLVDSLSTPNWRAWSMFNLGWMKEAQGQLAAAVRWYRAGEQAEFTQSIPAMAIGAAIDRALVALRYRGDTAAATATVREALASYSLAAMDARDRPYSPLIRFHVEAGQVDRARQLAAEYQREVPATAQRGDPWRHAAMGQLALATGDTAAAVRHFRAWNSDRDFQCATHCGFFELATSYDAWGQPDSALVWYERLIRAPAGLGNPETERRVLAPTYRRLGELYEARGDTERAVRYYGAFVELWRDADPVLQPLVADVRARIAQLTGERRR